MKKLLLTTLVATVAATGVYAQGTIAVDNLANGNTSTTATSGGLVFLNGVADSGPFSITVLGGASAASLSPIVTLTSANLISGGPGLFFDASGGTYTVPGVAGSATATLEVEAWTGNFATYAAAVSGGGEYYTTAAFSNGTGGGGIPPATPVDLVGMPAVLMNTPEPSTIALGGLGAAALMFFRRRNK